MKPRRQTELTLPSRMRDMEDPEFSDLIAVQPEHLGERPGHCREDYLAADLPHFAGCPQA